MNHATHHSCLPPSPLRPIWCCLLGIALSVGAFPSSAQSVTSARIESGSTNRLAVTFNQPVTVSNAAGFRLVGGAARIDRLLSGSGGNTLIFALTDYVLPDDTFRVLHWPEMSDARSSSGKLGAIDRAVANNATNYNGNGTLYYVSTSGSDSNSGTNKNTPLKTVEAAQTKAGPGDFILLRRGDVWEQRVIISKSGAPNRYITYAAYGQGAKPIIHSKLTGKDNVRGVEIAMATIAIRGADYIQVDNIHVRTDGKGTQRTKDDGIQLGDGSKYATVSNCIAEGVDSQGYFGIRVTVDGLPNTTFPQVLNCEVFNFYANMGTQVWPYDFQHGIEEGGLIENCISRDPIEAGEVVSYVWENLMINRGDFNGFTIRKNRVYNYAISGIETFGSRNVIIEYNEVYDPLDFERGGLGIKAGGSTLTTSGDRFLSDNIIVRYNKVHDIIQGDDKDVNAIDAQNTTSGKIYGNLIYNVRDIGIKIPGQPNEQGWDIHNNTVLNCGIDAIQLYTDGPYAANVRIKNNIVQGAKFDINCIVRGISQNATGSNNILINNKTAGAYQSTTDFQASLASLFVNPGQNDYRLKNASPAVNAGTTDTPPYQRDIRGFLVDATPDIGAYEFGDQFGPVDPEPPTDSENGVAYAYYEDASEAWSVLPNFTSLSPQKEGTLSNFNLSPAEQDDHYGFRYTTYLQVNTAGSYTFYTNTDDGSKLYVNDQGVVNNDGLRPPVEKSGSLTLPVGKHKLVVHYFEGYGGQLLEVKYAGPGISKQTIPDNLLFLQGDDTPPTQPTVRAQAGNDRSVSVNASPVTLSGFGQGPNPFRGYLWQKLSGPSVTLTKANTANVELTNLSVGTYVFRFTATDSEGNSGSDELTLTVTGSSARTASGKNQLTGDLIGANTQLLAYPNPVSNQLNVQVPAGQHLGGLVMIDLAGKIVRHSALPGTAGKYSLDVRDVPAGMYFVRWQADRWYTTKVVVEH